MTDENPAASFAQTFQWNRACIDHLGFRPESVLLVVASRGEQVEAFFPFIFERQRLFGFEIKVLRLPKHRHIGLHDVALRVGDSHANLVGDLFRFLRMNRKFACDVIDFGNVLEGSVSHEVLSYEAGARVTVIRRRVCEWLPVMSEDQLQSHVSKNMRANLRKAKKALGRYDQIEFLTSRDPDRLPGVFDQFLQVEASGWKGAEGTGTAILLDEHLSAFYRQLLDSFGADGRCEIDWLQIDGQVAAGQFGVIAGRGLHLLKIGYDPRFARVSPGQALLAHTLSRLHAQGEIDKINLITDTKWHKRWRPARLNVHEARCYDSSLLGALAYAERRLRARLGRWRRSLSAVARRKNA